MSELCKECFIDIWQLSDEEINQIVMSDDIYLCEGCGEVKEYVLEMRGD